MRGIRGETASKGEGKGEGKGEEESEGETRPYES